MKLKRRMDDKAVAQGILQNEILLSIIVISVLLFASLWAVVGANPLAKHKYVAVDVDIGATGLQGVTIDDTNHYIVEERPIENLGFWDNFDPTSQKLAVKATLFSNGEKIDTEEEAKDVGLTDLYMETFNFHTGPLPDDSNSYRVEVEVFSDGSLEDSTTLEGTYG